MVLLPTVGIPFCVNSREQRFRETTKMAHNNAANQLVLKGTTTIGVVCKDGVILASDTRVTMGYFVAHKQGKKVYKIDNHIGMTIAGSVADAQKVIDIITANAQLYRINLNRPMPIQSAARMTSNLLFSARGLMAQILVGGVDDSGPHLYNLDPFGSLTEDKVTSTGSGSPLAIGVLEDKFKEGMTVEEALPIVARAVNAAMKRDVASGNNYNIIVIDTKGYRELSESQKKTLLSKGS
jgi:proteasome beta subunit